MIDHVHPELLTSADLHAFFSLYKTLHEVVVVSSFYNALFESEPVQEMEQGLRCYLQRMDDIYAVIFKRLECTP